MMRFSLFLVLCAVLGVIRGTSDSFPPNEVSALLKFKEAIYEDPYSVLSDWTSLDSDPCDWPGISCSTLRDHVLKLNISGSSLKGFLPPELGQLSSLQQMILHGNTLIGIIPKEIGMLKDLKVLDLGANQLTGPIPREIGNAANLTTINFQSNGLTGRLLPELGNLQNLEELRLDRNRLQGTVLGGGSSNLTSIGMYASGVKGFCHSPHLKFADFSYNFFVGTIPKCLEYLPRTSFQGNCFQNKDIKQRPPAQCGGGTPSKRHSGVNAKHRPAGEASRNRGAGKPAWLLALEIVTGTMAGSLFLIALLTTFHRFKSKSSIIIPWKKSAKGDHMTLFIDPELLKNVSRFSRQELEVACEDFSNIIGSSPDSLVYKGTIKGGPEIAVISLCINEELWTGYLELYFQREVADLARLTHDHVGKLLGYCRENNPFTRMLVLEYASNGTLYEHLHYGEGNQLSWIRRMKIAIGIARGLKYLHAEIDPPFTISELSTSAVYLTEDFAPKLVDFESWKSILARAEKSACSIGNQGAMRVLPDSSERRHLDLQGNVHAFGVLLLEIISGRPPYCKEKGCLVEWAKDYLDLPEVMSYVVDPDLEHFGYDDLKVICEAVNLCIHPEPSKRPSMQELCSMLEDRIDISVSAELRASSLAWAELALSS